LKTSAPSRGEIWRLDLEPVKGHEQGRTRPALIVSTDILNHGHSGLVTIIPLTTKPRPIRTFLRVNPPEGGLSQTSYIICDQIRTISRERFGKRMGAVAPKTLSEVELRLKFLLDLP
jgi:mRNA interferase MazF